MGEFLAMSGVGGASRRDVIRCLEEFATSRDGRMLPISTGRPFDHLVVAGGDGGPVTVLYPSEFSGWWGASCFLSASLGVPVFSLHVHDGDLWMYVLFRDGEEIDHFNPIPDYWSIEMSPEERSFWMGDADVIASNWGGVDAASVEKYLETWDLDEDERGKAYEDDAYPFGDCWQLTDFMRKLGLVCPVDGQGRVLGETYVFEVSAEE